jgi:transcriptional regulator with XRE-family HTH domain
MVAISGSAKGTGRAPARPSAKSTASRAVKPASPAALPAAAGAVLTKATLRAAALLGLSNAALARVVGVSESTVSRLASGQRALEPGTKPAELAALLVRLYRSLDAMVGNSDRQRQLWMASYNRAFNAAPKDAIESADGLSRVLRYLDGARAVV